ncbi:hypothetical protein DUI87_07384 [Hirundo rustica rustica]|uniref:Reverse transcriptase domain-containing protein n=1 Tax=Hirundo rustica rustica TaxID=333673 RepID=A0A3M0KWP5_HIRRU|nr:hypothetical protein DUI87_07384 [Hirundo rustica rustica]
MPEGWKKANVSPVFKGGKKEEPGNYWSITSPHFTSPHFSSPSRNIMEYLFLEAISIHIDYKYVIRSSQHGLTKGKSYLEGLIALCDEAAIRMDERRAMDIFYLDFKTFDTVSRNILTGKLRKCGVGEWTERWFENWLNSRSQRASISGTGSR